MKEAQCLLCSSAQNEYVSAIPGFGNILRLCSGFCKELYKACGDVVVKATGKSIKSTWKKNETVAFCFDVWEAKSPNARFKHFDVLTGNCEFSRPCKPDDYEGVYTPCINNKRDALFFLKDDVKCVGGYPAPAKKTGLPCDITCREGQALLVGSTECTECHPGTFSIGGGDTYENWDEIPRSFFTYCNQSETFVDDCGWEERGSYIWSGNHTEQHSISVNLETLVTFIRDGEVRFEAHVSSESYDVLRLYVDNKPRWTASNNGDYETVSIPIQKGGHRLRWSYEKDFSVSEGQDAAFIRWIQFRGTKNADESCSKCEPGTHASDYGASECTPCPDNTSAEQPGQERCDPCPEGTYSFRGADKCSQKEECDAIDDYVITYTECQSDHTRFKTKSPLPFCIGDDIQDEQVACANCPDGTYRASRSSTCQGCPSAGQYLPANTTQCQSCPAGSYTPRYLIYEHFDESWDSRLFVSGCEGECGSQGWRETDGDLDSGYQHGSHVTSSLTLPFIDVSSDSAAISFEYSLDCDIHEKNPCRLQFVAHPSDNFTAEAVVWNSVGIPNNRRQKVTLGVATPGLYTLSWIFEKSSSLIARNDDAASLHKIKILSPAGSASQCLSCPAGTKGDGTTCTPCPKGHYSDAGSSQCLLCPSGSITPEEGMGFCKACGNGTTSTTDRTSCIDPCQFVPAANVQYDLTPLSNKTFGPIVDLHGETYYLGVCGARSIAACNTEEGILNTYACQVLNRPPFYAKNIGQFPSYELVQGGGIKDGFVLKLLDGSVCGNGAIRNTSIHFLCDSEAGLGAPEGVEPVESPQCHYNLLWRSIYACPICTSDDYTAEAVTGCINGKVKMTYRWNNPKNCHGGPDLPEDVYSDCSISRTVCGAGKFWNNTAAQCQLCPAGYYCLDGGVRYDSFTELPTVFNQTGEWHNFPNFMMAGGGAELTLEVNFQRPGNVTTSVDILGGGKLALYIDNKEHLFQARDRNPIVSMSAGTHQITWRFTAPETAEESVLIIHSIEFTGIFFSNENPVRCAAGKYSPVTGRSSCSVCPAQTEALDPGATSCKPCPKYYNSYPGEPCRPMSDCTDNDYFGIFGDCIAASNTGQLKYRLIDKYCRERETPGAIINGTVRSVKCPTCAPGFTRTPNKTAPALKQCVSCPDGSTLLSSGGCATIPAGSVAERSLSLWIGNSTWSEPEGFTTGCNGVNCRFPWRIHNGYIDSGTQGKGFSETWLLYETDFEAGSYVKFTYEVKNYTDKSGLEFFLDGNRHISVVFGQTTPRTVTIKVPEGKHKLRWSYHHQTASMEAEAAVKLSQLVIFGDAIRGGAGTYRQCPKGSTPNKAQTACVPCPPGSYADAEGLTSCKKCKGEYFTDLSGSSSCNNKCPKGTAPNADHSACDTDCIFTMDNDADGVAETYNLNPLQGVNLITTPQGDFVAYSICDRLPANFSNPDGPKMDAYVLNIQQGRVLGRTLAQLGRFKDENIHLYFQSTSDNTQTLSVRFFFYCQMPNETDPNYQPNRPPVVTSSSPRDLIFKWYTPYACPLCGDWSSSDYTMQATDCNDGKRTVSYARATNCFGPQIVNSHEEDCTVKYEFPMYVLITVAVIFLVLALAAILVYLRYRSLTTKYSLLVEEKSKNLEMSDIQSNNSSSEDLRERV